jgi:hypothetical protein
MPRHVKQKIKNKKQKTKNKKQKTKNKKQKTKTKTKTNKNMKNSNIDKGRILIYTFLKKIIDIETGNMKI